ncbi:DUF3545 family protein [Shewanella sp. SR43-4]|jgi:hypothetical protein|uniref:DUF3545 family protein n=1 Tax=Shewanella vesiculosa TaxID=518738 RepID=A0ABV0FSW8_9GAMM|nr:MULTISPECIES: DUF3545 family protein [Shewanella]NCQ44612.1 DUF3545 family protein [Shewanella frigidimarina]MBB1318723.1 DUF3545 family protein [Shewanella sp. SR43-4]MBB1321345.1 DUF3545 family protein [Shewanella sp. SR43-8]MBB1390658.1 DUF3545 family protein [Shewanella sp. SG44-6]MBB1474268.1 DUF3545 family protein [Shewanella sp. SG41-3]|tara:strand:+ start:3381 stop:3566 length:186 start_codon:yes stop_codon:yes gene_type:complete
MDRLDYGGALDEVVERPSRSKSSPKKRKWREIEAIKDKQRLLRELQDIDDSFDFDVNTLVL